MNLVDKYLGEAEMVWITQIQSRTHYYQFIGGAFLGKPGNEEARKKAKTIRKKYPELKNGTISISKFHPNIVKSERDRYNKLIELPVGAQK